MDTFIFSTFSVILYNCIYIDVIPKFTVIRYIVALIASCSAAWN